MWAILLPFIMNPLHWPFQYNFFALLADSKNLTSSMSSNKGTWGWGSICKCYGYENTQKVWGSHSCYIYYHLLATPSNFLWWMVIFSAMVNILGYTAPGSWLVTESQVTRLNTEADWDLQLPCIGSAAIVSLAASSMPLRLCVLDREWNGISSAMACKRSHSRYRGRQVNALGANR